MIKKLFIKIHTKLVFWTNLFGKKILNHWTVLGNKIYSDLIIKKLNLSSDLGELIKSISNFYASLYLALIQSSVQWAYYFSVSLVSIGLFIEMFLFIFTATGYLSNYFQEYVVNSYITNKLNSVGLNNSDFLVENSGNTSMITDTTVFTEDSTQFDETLGTDYITTPNGTLHDAPCGEDEPTFLPQVIDVVQNDTVENKKNMLRNLPLLAIPPMFVAALLFWWLNIG